MYSIDEPPPNSGLSLAAVRALYQLDTLYNPVAFGVRPYAKRPPCSHCGRTVVRHSYHHLATGVVCHQCLYSKERAARRMEYANRLLQVS